MTARGALVLAILMAGLVGCGSVSAFPPDGAGGAPADAQEAAAGAGGADAPAPLADAPDASGAGGEGGAGGAAPSCGSLGYVDVRPAGVCTGFPANCGPCEGDKGHGAAATPRCEQQTDGGAYHCVAGCSASCP